MKNFLALSLILIVFTQCEKPKYDLVIRNATVYDGSGAGSVVQDIGINKDTIAALGDLSGAVGTETIDAKGLALTPGFIDAHSHHDWGIEKNRSLIAAVSQGITTIIVGQDGGSNTPLRKYFQMLADSPVAVNIGSYSGHNTIRDVVLGKDFKRHSTNAELDSMIAILKNDMDAGALGLSTGLEYDPGIYSSKDEVLAMAKVLPKYRGRYISHLRSEDRYFDDAFQEIISIGREAKIPVQISHFKLAMRGLWGRGDSTIAFLNKVRDEGVDITADIYPYAYWSSTIRVLFPDRNFTDLKEAAFILKEVTTAENIILNSYEPNPEYAGKTLKEIATIEKKSPEATLIELIARLDACDRNSSSECEGSILATSMDEDDIRKLMKWDQTGICSDGASVGRHPRGSGAFTKVLRYYVRETNTLTLPEAIHKMTSLTASSLGIKKRGLIKTGYYADLVLFNPATVSDRSTVEDPQRTSEGIEFVFVNGVKVYSEGKASGKFPGQVIKR